MQTIAVVQARFGSSRLRGKAMRPLSAGRPMLYWVLRRALAIQGIQRVILATSVAEYDKMLCWVADDLGILSIRGDERDVLGRFHEIVTQFNPDAVMRITGDCPLLAPDVCALVLERFQAGKHVGYVNNDTTISGYPDGFDCEVFSRDLVRAAHLHATSAQDREHVTTWMRRHTTPIVVTAPHECLAHAKLSVDSQEDFDRVQKVYSHLDGGGFSSESTLDAYRRAFPSDTRAGAGDR